MEDGAVIPGSLNQNKKSQLITKTNNAMTERKCTGFVLLKEYPGCKTKKGSFEPFTTGEFLKYPDVWEPVYNKLGETKVAKPPIGGLSYGQALEAAKEGKLISREGWNGKGMFVFMMPFVCVPYSVFNSLASVPKKVREFYKEKSVFPYTPKHIEYTISLSAYLCLKAADDSIVTGWLASQTDMLANDWCILP